MNQPSKRIKREELYEAVWSRTIKALAQEWNTTYLRLVQACEEMEVPRPSQGHWQLVARGLAIEKEPLPERTRKVPDELTLIPQGVRSEKKKAARETVVVAKAEGMQAEAPKVVDVEGVGNAAATPAPRESQEPDLAWAAERAVLDMIRQATRIDFWQESISECVYPSGLAGWLKLEKGMNVADGKLHKTLKNFREEYKTFLVEVKEAKDRYDQAHLVIKISLREGCEWKDAWEEAWTFAENPNPHRLSDNALRLYLWAKGSKNTGKMTDRRKIGAQARLRKTYDNHRGPPAGNPAQGRFESFMEKDERAWHGQIRIWFEKKELVFYHHGPLNPPLGLDVREVGHAELLPGVIAVKVVNGSAVFLAADYYAGSTVIENCVSKILRYLYSGFDAVLIGVPSEEVKDQILHEIDSKIAERLGIRRNIAVVVIGQQEKERRPDEVEG